MSCWYLTNDLLFSSRVSSVAQRLERELVMLSSPAALTEKLSGENVVPPTLVLIDLSLPGLEVASAVQSLQALAPAPQIIAYGPHVHEARLADAQAAGCDAVLPRGQFDRQVEAILRLA